MDKENFESLKQSIIEAGKIMRGEMPASREVFFEKPNPPTPTTKLFAVCVETDDPSLLIPHKVYEIEVTGEYARVIDEEEEVAIYPADFFIPINLPVEITQRLCQTVR